MMDTLFQRIGWGRFAQKCCDLGGREMDDAIRGKLIQFRRGRTSQVIGNGVSDLFSQDEVEMSFVALIIGQ